MEIVQKMRDYSIYPSERQIKEPPRIFIGGADGIGSSILISYVKIYKDVAPEYVEVMWKILQQESPDDFVIGTGESRSVREFVESAFGYAGLDWSKHVEQDSKYFRPNEVNELCADSSKSQYKLNWSPKIRFEEIVKIMVDADLESLDLPAIGEGRKIIEDNFGEWHL